jgi:hypothetical protein
MIMFPIEPERFKPARVRALVDVAITLISPPGHASASDPAQSKPRRSAPPKRK